MIHMEAAVQGLAAIIVNAYRGAAESRGARGSAGSGIMYVHLNHLRATSE